MSHSAFDRNFRSDVGTPRDSDRCWAEKSPSCSRKSNAFEPEKWRSASFLTVTASSGSPALPALVCCQLGEAIHPEPRTSAPFGLSGHIERPFHRNLPCVKMRSRCRGAFRMPPDRGPPARPPRELRDRPRFSRAHRRLGSPLRFSGPTPHYSGARAYFPDQCGRDWLKIGGIGARRVFLAPVV